MGIRLPHDEQTEATVIGTMLVHPQVIDDVACTLAEDDIYSPKLRALYTAIVKVSARGDAIGWDTVGLQLQIDGHQHMGESGFRALEGHAHASPATIQIHTRRLRDIGEARRLATAIGEVQHSMGDLNSDPLAWVEGAKQSIADAAEARRESKAKPLHQIMEAEIATWKDKKEGSAIGMAYGLRALDDRTLGIRPPEYVIIASRPSIGKSSVASQLALHLGSSSWRGNRVHVRFDYFESSSARLIERMLAQQSRIDYRRIQIANFSVGDIEILAESRRRISNMKIDVEDESCDEAVLIAKWRSWRHDIGKDNPCVIIADYLQIIPPSRPELPREAQVTMASRACRLAAKRLNCGIIMLCQFNRDVEKRGARSRPQLSDLRESGSIEQDASTVVAIHRPGAIAESDEERKKKGDTSPREDPRFTELITLKARDGEVGVDTLSFNGRILTFEQVDPRPEPDGPAANQAPSFNPRDPQPD